MKNRAKNFGNFVRDEEGAVAIEYSLIAGAMFLAISPAFYIVRDSINVKFADIRTYLLS
jgi:Flp pilus assembly pilin Flp